MKLTEREEAILNGSEGEVRAKIMKTLVMYGDAFNADRMVPITSEYGHLVTSFGLGIMKSVYELMDKVLADGITSGQKFSVDPRPDFKNIPANPLQKLFFKVMYNKQGYYDDQLKRLGLIKDNAYTCTCYMPEVGNVPKCGDVLSWAESSAVVYANSVLGARCNRNSGIIELFGSIMGCVPHFGLVTDEGRMADWVVEIKTTKMPEAQVLGSAIGMKVMEDVPYVIGLDKYLGKKLNDEARDYLKDFGAATASNGAVGLYHIENLTPEAKEQGRKLIKPKAKVYVIDDAELERVYKNYPVIWKNKEAKPKLCFIGCPHLSLSQLKDWTEKIRHSLDKHNRKKVTIKTVLTTAPAVADEFKKTKEYEVFKTTGCILSSICPLMYMDNPMCVNTPVITCSNKLRTYTTSRFYKSDDLLEYITGGKR